MGDKGCVDLHLGESRLRRCLPLQQRMCLWFWYLFGINIIGCLFTFIFNGHQMLKTIPLYIAPASVSRTDFKPQNTSWGCGNASGRSSAALSRLALTEAKDYVLSQEFIQGPLMPHIPEDLQSEKAKQLDKEALMERSFFRLQQTKVNPFPYDFVLTPENFCSNDTFLVILIHSYHEYADRRQTIRETWGSIAHGVKWPHRNVNVSIQIAYVLGLHVNESLNNELKNEAKVHNDIIQGNFIESYSNLTLKSVLGLRFFAQYCSKAKFYLKTDDDIFINIPYWVELLQYIPMHRSIMGSYHNNSRVYRSNKWRVNIEDYPFRHYTPYEYGSGYVIDGGLIKELFNASEYVPSIPVEDVYVTGILGRILNVTHVVLKGAPLWQYGPPKSCEISGNLTLVGHKLSTKKMLKTWQDLINDVAPCPKMNTDN